VACFEGFEHPYDVLLDDFEPGMTTAKLRPLLAELVDGLVPLVAAARRRPEPRLVLVATIALLGVPLLLWGNQRFHLPLYPYLVILAAAVIDLVARRTVRR
jgi:hypothetical protein